MKEKKICIYVSTPKAYEDVFGVFTSCFEKYWGKCKYQVYVSSNYCVKCPACFSLVYNSQDENDGWTSRTKEALRLIDYDYVLVMMDDSLLWKTPDEREIDAIVEEMDKYNINYCKLTGLKRGKKYNGSPYINLVKTNTPYAKNLFVGIFRKSFLLAELETNNISSWDLEQKWLLEAKDNRDNSFYRDIVISRHAVIKVDNAVFSGKWFGSSIRKIKRNDIPYEKKREIIGFFSESRLKLGGKIGKILPPKLRLFFKKIMKKMGFKFKYDV